MANAVVAHALVRSGSSDFFKIDVPRSLPQSTLPNPIVSIPRSVAPLGGSLLRADSSQNRTPSNNSIAPAQDLGAMCAGRKQPDFRKERLFTLPFVVPSSRLSQLETAVSGVFQSVRGRFEVALKTPLPRIFTNRHWSPISKHTNDREFVSHRVFPVLLIVHSPFII